MFLHVADEEIDDPQFSRLGPKESSDQLLSRSDGRESLGFQELPVLGCVRTAVETTDVDVRGMQRPLQGAGATVWSLNPRIAPKRLALSDHSRTHA